MKINSLEQATAAAPYFDPEFCAVLEDHMSYLRTHPKTTAIAVEAERVYVYQFDLFGLFNALKIEKNLHYIVMRLAGMTSPTDLKEGMLEYLLVPEPNTVNHIRTSHQSTRRITA